MSLLALYPRQPVLLASRRFFSGVSRQQRARADCVAAVAAAAVTEAEEPVAVAARAADGVATAAERYKCGHDGAGRQQFDLLLVQLVSAQCVVQRFLQCFREMGSVRRERIPRNSVVPDASPAEVSCRACEDHNQFQIFEWRPRVCTFTR